MSSNRDQRFVIVVDAQRDFLAADGALSVEGAEALVAPMNAWLARLRPEETAGVLFTLDTHVPEIYSQSAEAREFPPHCVRGTDGWRLIADPEAIDPAIPVWRLEKGVFAMWEEDDLPIEDARHADAPTIPRDAFFADLTARGIERVTVFGVAADYCVRWAIDGLVARGLTVEVPAALTRGIARQIDQVVAEDFTGADVTVA